MRKTIVVPFIFVLFGVFLGVSSDQTESVRSRNSEFLTHERAYTHRTHEPLVEAYGPSRSGGDLSFGDNPVIEHQGHSNVKTSQRRKAALPENIQGREPSIQAYGLPKRTIESNGEIERVNMDRISGLDGKVDKVRNGRPGVQAYGLPKRTPEDNGVIERLGLTHGEEESSPHLEGRRTRSVDGLSKNDLVDLEAQEAKVFRPLFVYRQQVADRYRLNPRKNPIYGSYQYGANRQRNSISANRKH